MEHLIDILFTAAGGGIFGIAGGLIGKWLDLRAQAELAKTQLDLARVNNAHELLVKDKELAYLNAEAKNAQVLAELNAAKERDVADMNAMGKSYENDKRTYSTDAGATQYALWFVVVDFARGITRPLLTAGLNTALMIVFGFLSYMLFKEMPEILKAQLAVKDKTLLVDTFVRVVDALTFMASTATMWWFAARGIQPRAHKRS